MRDIWKRKKDERIDIVSLNLSYHHFKDYFTLLLMEIPQEDNNKKNITIQKTILIPSLMEISQEEFHTVTINEKNFTNSGTGFTSFPLGNDRSKQHFPVNREK